MKIIELKERDILFHEGDASESMYIVKSGSIAIKKKTPHKETLLAVIRSQQLIGEMSFFEKEPRTATAEALTKTVVIELPFQSLHKEFQNAPNWIKTLTQTMRERLKEASEKINTLNSMQQQSAKARLFSHYKLQILSLINFLSQSYQHMSKSSETSSYDFNLLKTYAIQVFHKDESDLEHFVQTLSKLNIVKIKTFEDELHTFQVLQVQTLHNFVNWYKDQLTIKHERRVSLEIEDIPVLETLLSQTQAQAQAQAQAETEEKKEPQETKMKLGKTLISIPNIIETLTSFKEKGFIKDIKLNETNEIFIKFFPQRVEKLLLFWKIVYALKNKKK